MPVTKAPTHHRPAIPVWENTASDDGGACSPKAFTIGLEFRLHRCQDSYPSWSFSLTPSSCPILR